MTLDLPGAREPATRQAKSSSAPVSMTAEHRHNNTLAMLLAGLVALAPLPLASNRPFFWALSACFVGVTGLGYFWALARIGGQLRFPLARVADLALLTLAVVVFLAIQTLPLYLAPAILLHNSTVLNIASISVAPGVTWLMIMQLSGYALFFFLMLQVAVNRWRAELLLRALYIIVVAYAAFGLVNLTQFGDTMLGIQKWAYEGSATATFVNRNSFATFLAMGLVVGASLLFTDHGTLAATQQGLKLTAVLGGMFIIGAALFATQSRMGLTAGLAGACSVLVLAGFKMRWRWPVWGLIVLSGFVAVIVMISSYGTGVVDRLVGVEGSIDGRLLLYGQVGDMIATRPWLGFGGGTFEWAFPLFHESSLNTTVVWDRAHSTYLQLWAEMGILAGSVPLIVIGLVLIRAVLEFAREKKNWTAPVAAVGAVSVAAIHSLVDFSLEIQANTYLFLAILAIGIGGHAGHAPTGRSA